MFHQAAAFSQRKRKLVFLFRFHNQSNKDSMKPYILFHYPCTDGLGAKFAAWEKYGKDAVYCPVDYNQAMPEIPDGAEVYILDFSYPKEQLRALRDRVSKLVVLDHHKTAQEELAGEEYATFDMNKSGAVLAWEYFHPGTSIPKLLIHIQDRDLWKWEWKDTKDILNFLSVHGEDVSTWGEISKMNFYQIQQGRAITKYQNRYIESCRQNGIIKFTTFMGYKVAIANTTTLPSELGNMLYETYPIDFSITWYVDGAGVVKLSFRSQGNFDVSVIAKKLGGGGHKTASGARISMQELTRIYETKSLTI